MRLAGVDVEVDDQVGPGERPDEARKQASPGQSVHPAQRELAVKVPVHDHQAGKVSGRGGVNSGH